MDPAVTETLPAHASRRHLATVQAARGAHDGGVRLLDVEPGLGQGLSAEELEFARRTLVVPTVAAGLGRWVPGPELAEPIAVLVLDGLLLRNGSAAARSDVRCFGPGDLVDPRVLADRSGSWRVLQAAELALLDHRVIAVARRCPELFGRLAERLFDGHQEQHVLAALRSLPRVEERILALLGHHASRWGRATRDGITLVFPVTHELLGRLVGARRPTVSLALSVLREQELLTRLPDGRWLLPAAA